MADLGAIGTENTNAQLAKSVTSIAQVESSFLYATVVGVLKKISTGGASESDLTVGLGKNVADGSPAPPCLEMDRKTNYDIFWPIEPNVANTFTAKVKQPVIASLQPRVTIIADASLGVNADVTGTAAASTGWVTIGPLTVNPTSAGVLLVRLENRSMDQDPRSYWDCVVVSPGTATGDFVHWYNGVPKFGFGGVAAVSAENSRSFVV